MATIHREITIDAGIDAVWDALRDFSALHERLAVGFVTGCSMEAEGLRVVTFFNGMTAREQLVGLDEAHHRLAYTIVGGRASHHHASAQLFAEGPGKTRFVWIADVLPDALAAPFGAMMEQGAAAMKKTLER